MQKYNFVLLIDDDEVTNFIHENLISGLHLSQHIEKAADAAEALRMIRHYYAEHESEGPDLILLDIKMPVLDGFDFLEAFKMLSEQNINPTKVIAVTSFSNLKNMNKLQQMGVYKLISKPLTKEKIMSFAS